jgi:hypothetical protein
VIRLVNKLAIVALFGGLTAVSATSAQAARDGVFSSYDPTFAYTGDPAYAQSRAKASRQPAYQQIRQGVSGAGVGARSRNLPYSDRPYGDPGRW